MPKISLYLMTYKGYYVLHELINAGLESIISDVVIGEDKSVSNDYSSEIVALCDQGGIKYTFNRRESRPDFDYIIAISWRWVIHDTKNVIVVHDSLLPKYRGFAPLVNQLINGEKEIGVSAIFASERYDEGDVILQKKIAISYPIKISEAIKKISSLYALVITEIVKSLSHSIPLKVIPQEHSKATYSLWRDRDDYQIDWQMESHYIKRFIDAVGYPFDGAKTILDGEQVRITEADTRKDVDIEIRQPGKVIFVEDNYPVIVCGKGLLTIKAAYYENGNSIIPLKKFRSRFC